MIRRHVAAMRYARIDGALVSWWGRGSSSDARLARLLRRPAGPRFRWAIYYEPEGQGNPSPARIRADLRHVRARHASQRDFLRIGGRFVVFVYGDAGDGCAMARRWRAGRISGAYVVLKVFPGYRSCAAQPDGWHQYAPAVPRDEQPGFSVSISPGFFHADEDAPRLGRNLPRWRRDVARMVRSRAPFQLITTFNEWGEGTAVENSRSWSSPSGYGDYLDVLHANPTLDVRSGSGVRFGIAASHATERYDRAAARPSARTQGSTLVRGRSGQRLGP